VSDPDADRESFVRGLAIGAILGAIVAGSSLWSRRRRGRRPDHKPAEQTVRLVEPPRVPDAG
jgi:hypothetical protein